MTIYKTILAILNKNRRSLLAGVLIMGIISFFYSGDLQKDQTEAKIAILTEDNSALSQAMINYLSKETKVISLKDSSNRGQDDALYFGEVEYILTIPGEFSEKLGTNEQIQVSSQTKPGTFSSSLVDAKINNFVTTYLSYQENLTNQTEKQLIEKTEKTLDQQGKIVLDDTYSQRKEQEKTGSIFNILAYGLFMSILTGYGVIHLAFNRPEINRRNRCAPFSRRQLSRKITVGNLFYSFTVSLLFVGFVLIITKSGWNQVTLYFLLNTLAFILTMISFSMMITSIIRSSESLSGINNTIILGSCFIGGIFVPSEVLPEIVNNVAAFTPTYWFAQNNDLIGETVRFNHSFLETFWFRISILIAFSAVFIVGHLLIMKEKRTNYSVFNRKISH